MVATEGPRDGKHRSGASEGAIASATAPTAGPQSSPPMSCAPPALSDAALAAALTGALQTEGRQPFEEALAAWESQPGFCSAVLRAYAAAAQLGQPERLLAVLCLKNAVTRQWNQRRDDQGRIPDAEKAALCEALIGTLDEPDPQLWAQLELLMAIIARLDGLAAWPALLPTLLDAACRPDPRGAARGLSALHRVVKQQASRRLLPHRKQFFALAAELLPRLQPLRHAHASALLAAIAQRDATATAAWLGASSGGGAGDAEGVWMLRAAVALCKLERQLLLHGWAHLHQHPEACALLGAYVELLEATEAQQQRLRAGSADSSSPAALEASIDATMPLLLVPAKLLMEVQDLQPLAMRDALPRAITFFLGQVTHRPFSQRGEESSDEKFLVRAVLFLRNALSTSAYLPTRQAPPHAHECQQVLAAFFGSPSLRQLVAALLTRALPLSVDEYAEYADDPESFVYEEHLARESGSLRKCAERCLLTLADTSECRVAVQAAVLELSNDAAAHGLTALPSILALDACYLALGLVLQGAAEASAQLSGVLGTLRSHCAVAAPEHAHLLRRRAAWLLGWMLRTPHFAKISHGAASAGAAEAAALMYTMLQELLVDEHPGVRLSAALAVQTLFDATDTSPRANTPPAPPPPPTATANGYANAAAAGGAAGGGGSDDGGDPLAQLASAALLQVLHLSLSVREIESRWRMGQLLCRLLARLATAPALLAPHLQSLAQWLPTAWAACGDEQLMREATLDAAATMVEACSAPELMPPLQLLAASLELVSHAIGGVTPTAPPAAAAAAAAAAGAPAGAAAAVWEEGGEPPVGVVEIALKLWRGCVAALRPPLHAELAPALLALAARLPACAELADELLRPSMLLLDWYFWTDRTMQSCAGRFAAEHAMAYAPTLEAALVESPGGHRRGSLAAIGTMHTILLCAPEQAASLQPALTAALTALVAPEDGPDAPNDLVLTSMAGVLGRALLCCPSVFSVCVAHASHELQLGELHVHFASAWVALVDAIVLASQRKLAALALVQLLLLDAALLPLTPDILSFCVSVLAEQPDDAADAAGGASPPPRQPMLPASGEHSEFTRRLSASGLDPLPTMPLRPALQQGLESVSVAHGEAFAAQWRALDPSLLQQVQQAFGPA